MAAPQSQVCRSKFGPVDNLLETPIENLLWVNVTPHFSQILTKRHDFEELPIQGFFDLGESIKKYCEEYRERPRNAILERNS